MTHPENGLGETVNREIGLALSSGNYEGLLKIIKQTPDRQLACEVIIKSMRHFRANNPTFVDRLVKTALDNAEAYGESLKQLISYTYKKNKSGGRFFKTPGKSHETLFLDDDGEIISFVGEIGVFPKGVQREGEFYIKTLGDYEVLTGPNAGKIFTGSYFAEKRNDPNYRPIKGTGIK